MPSSISRRGAKAKTIKNQGGEFQRAAAYVIAPDVEISVQVAAADMTGANSGKYVFVAPRPMHFLGGEFVYGVAGTNTFRIKKILAAATSAPGAAADANNVDMTAAFDLTQAANTVRQLNPVTTGTVPAYQLSEGDKVAIASAAGTASLAGGLLVLRFGYL
jgi:hypothetical protein